jgi:NAD(P)-dependent dehydrogenase (short-subunit alcohol dehydrogenase family)
MQIDIKDKVIVVTGAARGIGRALALGLAAEGARVGVLARSREKAQRTVDEIGGSAFPLVADVSSEDEVRAAAAAVDAHWGRVDGLINNAGWMPHGRPTKVLDLDAADLHRVLDTNLVGCFLATKHFAPLMIRGGGGRIIYMSSIGGVLDAARAGSTPYGASKAGVNILNAAVHHELGSEGIRTTAIAPGLTDTPGMRDGMTEEHLARVAGNYPGGRVGQPEDIVPFATFLCSDAANHLSGTVLTIRPLT